MRLINETPKMTEQSGTRFAGGVPVRNQAAHSIIDLHRTLGNQAVQRLLQSTLDAKSAAKALPPANDSPGASGRPLGADSLPGELTVGAPCDKYELEADRVAEQVMRMGSPGATFRPEVTGALEGVQRNCSSDHTSVKSSEGENGKLFRIPNPPRISSTGLSPPGGKTVAPPTVHKALISPGQPLDSATRAFMEPRFGCDFGSVRLHTGDAARGSNADLGARAYTVGRHIVLRDGSPSRALLAHELAHVVQQGSSLAPSVQRQGGGPDSPPSRDPNPKWVSPGSREIQPETPVYKVGPNDIDWRGTDKTFDDAIQKGFEKTGVPRDQFRETRWVKTDYGKTVPVEWQGPGGAEVNVDVPHLSPSPDIPHVGWKAAGKGGARGHIFVNETPYGRAPLNVPPAKYPTPPPRQRGKSTSTEHQPQRTSEIPQKAGKTAPESATKTVPETTPHSTSKSVPQSAPESVPETAPRSVPEVVPEAIPKAAPKAVPETVAPEVSRAPSIGGSAIRMAVLEIGLNVLVFAISYYLEKRHAKKQAEKLNSDLKAMLPDINTILGGKDSEIAKKEKDSPLLYANVTVTYTRANDGTDDYNVGSMKVQKVEISHQNYVIREHKVNDQDFLESMSDLKFLLTFSLPLFEEEAAERVGSGLIDNYRKVRDGLLEESSKVRLSATITLYKLALQDRSLAPLVIRDLLGLLRDEDAGERLAAAVFLGRLKAKIAAQYIPDAIPIAENSKQKELIQKSLQELGEQ